ncbi:hypothetical protein HLB27_01210 [Dickeya dadantii]|uniref:phenylalanine--tRNA ligase beta subunit-related protein n=1 Tax=Dickeya dadantii TaxID=204038 RepID=UPI0014956A89|nr:phenylalanine--tRNA ligase beta subunit-related protein [Dickeya dadantii]NPE59183.1 hypothetical protein [Dickeya dadantii]NPE69435.1 hypothetical protein [Dickeya dadantii]
MYFTIDERAANAGVTHALLLVVRGVIVSPSRENFKKKCTETVSSSLPSYTEKFNNGMREIISFTTGKSDFRTAGEKLRSNFSERGFRSINNVVDSYNEAAYFYGLGIGGHDISHVRNDAHLEVTLSLSEDKIIPLFDTRKKKINPGELIYKLEKKTVAWIGSKDVDSDEFRIGDETNTCAFVILGHSSVTATDLYTVGARIRRNLTESSYNFDSMGSESQEFYYNTRNYHD